MKPTSKANILIVDDHPENLIALEAILGSLGQNLVRANSGEEALRCLLYQDFAAILLDVQMPGMDGFETASLIRQRERSRHIPIIFITAFSTNDNFIFQGYALGAVDYLLKPIEPAILTSKVTVFVDLFHKTQQIQRQASELAAINMQLRQSEKRFRSLSNCAPIGIFLLDNNERCTYTNPSFHEICGLKLEENWDGVWTTIVHGEDRDRIIPKWSDRIHSGEPFEEEFRLYISEGSFRWVNVRTAPMLSEQKQLLGHVGTIEDISERKLTQAIREQMIREQTARKEAEAANLLKDEFLAVVSHELRTPLNSIMGWSQLLLTKEFEENTKTRALEIIQRNAQSQAQLIEDILDVSRIIRGKLTISIQTVNAIELIEKAIEMLHPAAEAKTITIETHLDRTASLISGDPERLQQIIWNLLSNAIKFTPQSGRIEVQLSVVQKDDGSREGIEIEGRSEITKNNENNLIQGQENTTNETLSPSPRLPLTASPSSGYARLQIIDNGIGMSEDFLPYIFDRFRQADSSPTRSYGGLGLGLTIVRHLVELHGGTIEAFSEGKDKGSTFTVYLPLASFSSTISSSENHLLGEVLPCLDGIKILLVEDDLDTRDIVRVILEEAQAQVTATASMKEAMACLQQANFHILVSDIAMPEKDGYQLIRTIRALDSQQGGQIPAIALSAYAREEDRLQALNAGFHLHIAKPFKAEELVTAIANLLHLSKTVENNKYDSEVTK
jgi:PAS domain S-box-containing protein